MTERNTEQPVNKEQALNGTRVALVYRSNKLYAEAMPLVLEHMRAQGISANLVSFPSGTSPEEINTNLTNRWGEFSGLTILTDRTVGGLIVRTPKEQTQGLDIAINPWAYHNQIRLDKEGYPDASGDSLDSRFNSFSTETILKANGATFEALNYQGSSDMEQTGKAFSAILGIALRKETPGKIFIEPQKLEQHAPFNATQLNEVEDELSPAEHIRKWIQNTGYPAENIKVLMERGMGDRITYRDWLIIDRHNQSFHSGTKFEMPVANLLLDMQKIGLITVEDVPSIEELAQAVASDLAKLVQKTEQYKQKLAVSQTLVEESSITAEPAVQSENPSSPATKPIIEELEPPTPLTEITAEPQLPVLPKQSHLQRFFNRIRKAK